MTPTPTAPEIISRVKARYAGCRSYEDTGEVTRVIVTQPEQWDRQTVKVSFKTAFVRPTYFYFESAEVASGPKSEWARGAAWKNDRGVFQWNTSPVPRLTDDPITLDLALAGMRGLGATNVPRLLGCLEHCNTPSLNVLATSTWTEWTGLECYVLEGAWRGEPHRVWVECATFMLRRADSRYEYADESPNFTAETTTVWHPRMNHAINPKVFEFTPPG